MLQLQYIDVSLFLLNISVLQSNTFNFKIKKKLIIHVEVGRTVRNKHFYYTNACMQAPKAEQKKVRGFVFILSDFNALSPKAASKVLRY